MSVSAISLPAGFSLSTSLPLDVDPSGNATFVVALDTSVAGALSGVMSITDDDPNNNPYTVNLSGTVTLPAAVMQLRQGSTNIANGGSAAMPAAVQGTSDLATFTVRNSGTAPLDVSAVTLPGGYSLQTSLPLSITAGDSATLVVALDTSAVGTSAGTMSISDTDASNDPYNISLSGTDYAPPAANDDSYSTSHLKPLTVSAASGVAANDSNPSQAPLTVEVVAEPQDGTLALHADGSFVYTPSATFVGNDSFTYNVVAQGVMSNTATVHVQVTNAAPIAADDNYSITCNTAFSSGAAGLLANDTDADGDFTYTPDDTFAGTDSFSYVVDDGLSPSAASTATITVNHASELPSIAPMSLTVHAGTTLSGDLLDGVSVPNGDVLTAQVVTQPADGTISLNSDGAFTYTPATGYVGSDSFTFEVLNGTDASSPISVTIDVTNTPPAAGAASYTTYLTTPLATTAADGLLAGASDADGDDLTVTLVNGPSDGTLTVNADGSFTYTADSGFTGTDSFSYQASDGFTETEAAVNIIVTANTVIAGVESFSVVHDHSLNVPAVAGVLRNDYAIDGGAITAQLVSATTHGTVILAADGSLSYSPAAGYVGDDQFSYQAVEDGSASAVVTDTIHVTDNAPLSSSDGYSVLHDRPLAVGAQIGVLANDYDDDRDALAATVVTAPAHGALSLAPDGSFTYTPSAGFVGSDSFSYTAGDGVGDGGPTTVGIDVTDTAPTGQGATLQCSPRANAHRGRPRRAGLQITMPMAMPPR